MENESDGDINCNRYSWYSHQRIGTGSGRLRNKRTNRDHPNYCVIEIGQNTEKSPGDLRFAVSQTPERNLRLTLLWKTLKRVKKWSKWLKKAMEYEIDGDTNSNLCIQNYLQRLGEGAGRVGNQKMSSDHPYYSIIKIGQNTEKSPGDLRRLAVTQTPVKKHQWLLVWKTHKDKRRRKIILITMETDTIKPTWKKK